MDIARRGGGVDIGLCVWVFLADIGAEFACFLVFSFFANFGVDIGVDQW